MARQVLLVEPDVDVLGKLAEELRARGLAVVLASDVQSAILRARSQRPHMIFLAQSLAESEGADAKLTAEPSLTHVPRLSLVRAASGAILPPDQASYDDLDRLVTRALEVKSASTPPESNLTELRGNVQQLSLVDLLQLLAMNRRTGVLVVSTPFGAGELRVADGEVLDAVYRRLEGEKAFYRLLAEREGSFVFAPGGPPAVARVTKGTSTLLMEAMRHKDEVARIRDELGRTEAWVATSDSVPPDAPRALTDVRDALGVPRTVDELIDELPAPDLDVLHALRELIEKGLVRGIDRASLEAQLCPPEHLAVLRALVPRLAKPGFSAPPRVVIASSPARVRAFGHALMRVAGAVAPAEPPPSAPLPHELGQLRLGEGADLSLVGLPTVDAFGPIWSLTLPGAGALVRLDTNMSPLLDAITRALEIKILAANDAVEGFDESDPRLVAQLLRAVIEGGAQ
jgi:hypothetical protein